MRCRKEFELIYKLTIVNATESKNYISEFGVRYVLEPRIVKSAVSSEWATKRAESVWGVKSIERIPSNAIFKKYPLIFTKE